MVKMADTKQGTASIATDFHTLGLSAIDASDEPFVFFKSMNFNSNETRRPDPAPRLLAVDLVSADTADV